jgi:hypothetical protein
MSSGTRRVGAAACTVGTVAAPTESTMDRTAIPATVTSLQSLEPNTGHTVPIKPVVWPDIVRNSVNCHRRARNDSLIATLEDTSNSVAA